MLLDRTVFKMYVKKGCPYCDKATKKIVEGLNSTLYTVDVTDEPELRQRVIEETGHKTVPAIWIGEDFIGGCDDLLKLCADDSFRVRVLTEEVSILRSEVIRLRRSL